MEKKERISICFVCLGNICRSPTAEAVMLQKIHTQNLQELISVDSAGTVAYHVGEMADARSREQASHRGYQIQSRARQFGKEDLDRFDYVIAMDRSNQQNIPTPLYNGRTKKQNIFVSIL